jgi:hypothetical protein
MGNIVKEFFQDHDDLLSCNLLDINLAYIYNLGGKQI